MALVMKTRLGLIFLGLVCAGLGLALVVTHKQASEGHLRDAESIETFSNQWVSTKNKYEDQVMLSSAFEEAIEKQKHTLADLSNNLTQTSANLQQANTSLAKDEAALKASEEEIKKRDGKIADLEAQNRTLDERATELCNSITNLTTEISSIRRQLASAQGDKVLLEQRLRQLITDKADLERQFSDLSIVRAQMSKLKEELITARRRDWIHQGLLGDDDQRGGQMLLRGVSTAGRKPTPPKPAYDLNVEVSSDGSVRIVQPTNAPAATNPPAK